MNNLQLFCIPLIVSIGCLFVILVTLNTLEGLGFRKILYYTTKKYLKRKGK